MEMRAYEERRAAAPLIGSRGHVRTQRAVWYVMRILLAPLNIACAAVAGAHYEHKRPRLRSVQRPISAHTKKANI